MRVKRSKLANRILTEGSVDDIERRVKQTFAAHDHARYLNSASPPPLIEFEGKEYRLEPVNLKQ